MPTLEHICNIRMTTGILRFTLLVALSLATTCLGAASVSNSGIDQYTTRHHDQSYPAPSFDEALKVIKSKHRFDVHSKKPIEKEDYPLDNDIVPDLQVGCGDGLLVETTTAKPVIPKHKRVYLKKERRRKREAGDRKSKSYFAYSVRTPASISYSIFPPQRYTLHRPYYIPVFGTKGRFPLYFPPQPVYENAGFPYDNPPTPNNGYLPAKTTTTTTVMSTLGDRFGSIGGSDTTTTTTTPSGPVWDMRPVEAATTKRPVPTARPSGPNTSTFPPLVHNPDPNQRPASTTARTTTSTTPPPLAARPPSEDVSGSSSAGDRGISQPQPNRCVWAIINCCSAGSGFVNESCFSRLGCPGPFWGTSPCESDFARVAIEAALNHYQRK